MLDGHFEEMLRRLKLTKAQSEDARTKWDNVSHSLFGAFYSGEYDKHTRLIFGSYGKKTQIRPVGDIDLIFKIPKEIFDQYKAHTGNGPSALLQGVRNILQQSYSTTDKIVSWGKVVLVEFPDGKHNVELLPAYELDNKKFIIPNSENGGSWDEFDPRYEMDLIRESNSDTGITRKLVRIIKRWKRMANVAIKSYELEYYCVGYLSSSYEKTMSWSQTLEGLFTWLEIQVGDDNADSSKVTTAKTRTQKAREYESVEKFPEACQEWIKILGSKFPVFNEDLEEIFALTKQFPSNNEMFIEDQYPIRINQNYHLKITSTITANGFRNYLFPIFLKMFNIFPKKASLIFTVTGNFTVRPIYYWKVRNFGMDAKKYNDGAGLRGEITRDKGGCDKKETTLYKGTHYIECYAVLDGVCVATARTFVPIGEEISS